jgi:arylsulfatase A-like enzyme
MEQLAREGMAFERVFSGAAICIPSRAIIASGLCSHRNGAIANGRMMKPGIKTLPAYMSELGYHVAHFGKSHFLPPENYTKWEAVPSEIKGEGPLNNDLDTKVFDQWLGERMAKSKEPLCLIVCSHSPHVMWEPNKDYDPAKVELPPSFVDTPITRRIRTNYYTDITKMDTQLGEVYRSVRKYLGKDALFIYTSDNGPQWPFAKWNLYDAGIHLPMIATWPGVIKPGTRSRAMINFTDFLPTFMELAGGKAPADIDGLSFAKVIQGKAKEHRREIYASHTADNNSQMNCYPMRAVRTERYKYIRNLHPDFAYHTHFDRAAARDGKEVWQSWVDLAATDKHAAFTVRRYHQRPAEELYDLQNDPHEMKNLVAEASMKSTLDELRGKVDRWMQGMNDQGELFGVPRSLKDVKLP